MKMKLRVLAAAIAAVTAMTCASSAAYADKLKNVGGTLCRFTDSGENTGAFTGLASSGGVKRFYKNGKPAENTWIKKGSKRFYVGSDGVLQTGWVKVGKSWYYIDAQEGMYTGVRSLGGHDYNFGSSGKWDCIYHFTNSSGKSIYPPGRLMSKLDSKVYGGLYLDEQMLVVWSVDGKAEAAVEKILPGASAGIVFRKADYSMYELNRVKEDLFGHRECWTGMGIYEMENRLHVEYTDEQAEALNAYLMTLADSGCVVAVLTDGEFYDD